MAVHGENGRQDIRQSVEAQPVFIRMLRGASREEKRVEGESEEESMPSSPPRIPPPPGDLGPSIPYNFPKAGPVVAYPFRRVEVPGKK